MGFGKFNNLSNLLITKRKCKMYNHEELFHSAEHLRTFEYKVHSCVLFTPSIKMVSDVNEMGKEAGGV